LTSPAAFRSFVEAWPSRRSVAFAQICGTRPLRLPSPQVLHPCSFSPLPTMEDGSPSRRSWADVADDDLPPPQEFFVGSPGLLVALARGPGGCVSLSDSEDYSDSDLSAAAASPPRDPLGKGKETAEPRRRRHRARRHRRKRRTAGFMADARRSSPVQPAASSPPRATLLPASPRPDLHRRT